MIKDTRNGLSMEKKEDRDLSNKILVEYFFELIKKNTPTCSIELGAFSADFSRNIKNKYNNMKVFAFEANPYNFEFFSEKYEFDKLGIEYINKAVSDKEEVLNFNIQRKIKDRELSPIRGNNSIMERNQENTDYENVLVNTISISNFVIENQIESERIVLWVDVEGANEKALKGCEKILDKVSLIFIEVEEKEYWINQWLENNVRDFLTSNNFVLVARDGEYEHQYNQIYINQNIIKI